ncbi:MAG: fimbrillin family protein, partial [Muribaculaceae bacterium]|nr:fimbrillin family protein [Muribaculaceae bacterium]
KAETVIARKTGATSYSAILVPQRLENRIPLLEVEMNGVSFLYESKFLFKPGVHHLVNLVIDKNPEQVKIEIGGEIEGWN